MPVVTGRASLAEGVLVDWAVAAPTTLPRLPVELLDREQTAAELQRVVAQRAMLAAYEAELVLALADDSPDTDDPPPGTRGARGSWGAETRLPGVSEFFPAELAMVLNCGRGTASNPVVRAGTWRDSLPDTWGALAAGVLDEPRAKALAEVLEHADQEIARRVEAELPDEAGDLSIRRLREQALALLLTHDAEAADKRRKAAEKSADVRTYPSPREGMATVTAELPADEAAAVELLRRLDALGVQVPEGGSVTLGVTDDDGALLATAGLAELRRLARRGCARHPAGDCGCAVLGRPPAVDRYSPSAAQQRFVRTRDRTCRFPNCGQRVGWADLDHVTAHACGGPTDCANLCCLCRSHHRLKTFARGWRFEMSDDGVLTVTTPSGLTRTTRPSGLRPPPASPPDPDRDAAGDPGADESAAGGGDGSRAAPPAWGIRELIRRPRVGPGSRRLPPGDDPPPF